MKSPKVTRDEFRQRMALQIVSVLNTGGGTNQIVVVLTLALAILDRYQGAKVQTGINLTTPEISKLTGPVCELLSQVGGSIEDSRLRSPNFWVRFLEEAEPKLKGFTKL